MRSDADDLSRTDTPAGDPQTVLMTTDAVGGVWTFAMELARALGASGARVVLAVLGPSPSDAQLAEATAVPGLTPFVAPYALEWMPDAWDDVARSGEWLLGLAREVRPNVVHLNGYAHGALPWEAPVVMTGHSCVCSWWTAVHGVDAPPEWNRYREAVAAGIQGARLLVAPTRAMLASLERHYGPVPSARVIPNGRSVTLHAAWPKEPIVLSVGRLWDDAKNVRTLCAAAPAVQWPVYVAGDTDWNGGHQPISGGVHPLGRVSAGMLASWYGRASIYAAPCRYEPFGLAPLEAAQAGCALVLGDIPSLREVWEDAAVYVPADDARALAAAVDDLIVHPERREAYAARARARARLYTPKRMSEGYHAAYRDVLRAVREVTCDGPTPRAGDVTASAPSALRTHDRGRR